MIKDPVSPVPEDFHTMTPQLIVREAAKAIEFYQRAFGAAELYRNTAPDGTSIMHAEMLLGDSRFFVNDEFIEWGVLSPESTNGSPVTLHLYVENADAVFEQAASEGAEVLMPLNNAFWGDRYGILKDPFGHRWSVASRLEDLSPAEVHERAKEFAVQFEKDQPKENP